jgi:hypothetical protein
MSKRLLFLALVYLGLLAAPATAQDPGTTTTSLVDVPTQDIVPEPGTGEEPEDPGDRGGGLQLMVLVLLVVAIGVVIAMVVRQSRRARAGG